jgi:hypothetical protein
MSIFCVRQCAGAGVAAAVASAAVKVAAAVPADGATSRPQAAIAGIARDSKVSG